MTTEDTTLNLTTMEPNSEIISNTDIGHRKKVLTDYFPARNEVKKTMSSKIVQVSLGTCMSDDNLCSDLPSEKYWSLVAEKKRIELKDALDENERLYKVKESLIKQMIHYKELLEEANSFIDVFKEVARDAADDTGIDVADLNDSNE